MTGGAPKGSTKKDPNKPLETTIGKATNSIEKTQVKYKTDLDKPVSSACMLCAGESLYLDTNEGVKKVRKLLHQVDGRFES